MRILPNSQKIIVLILVNIALIYAGLFSLNLFYAVRHHIEETNHNQRRQQLLKNFDQRTRMEVVRDLKAGGENAFPSAYPAYIDLDKSLYEQTLGFLPLSGLANKMTVFCNENGTWSTYKSDRYGFNNDDRLYDYPKITALLVGDSFAHGACVGQEDNIAGQLIKLGKPTLNLGMRANGPDLELASLAEYGDVVSTEWVVSILYPNDMSDLNRFAKHPVLKKYISDPGFSQNLRKRQREIDEFWLQAIRKFYEEQLIGSIPKEEKIIKKTDFDYRGLLPLRMLRGELYRAYIQLKNELERPKSSGAEQSRIVLPLDNAKQFQEILRLAKKRADRINAKFLLAYVPDFSTIAEKKSTSDGILSLVREAGITHVIDFEKHMLGLPQPLNYHPLGLVGPLHKMGYHLNERGYAALAKEISDYIDSVGRQ